MGRAMIQSVWRHKEALKNMIAFHRAESARLEALQRRVDEMRASIERLAAQIDRAIREGKEGFDSERYQPKKGGE